MHEIRLIMYKAPFANVKWNMCTISKCGCKHVQHFVNLEDISVKRKVALWLLTRHFVYTSKSHFENVE